MFAAIHIDGKQLFGFKPLESAWVGLVGADVFEESPCWQVPWWLSTLKETYDNLKALLDAAGAADIGTLMKKGCKVRMRGANTYVHHKVVFFLCCDLSATNKIAGLGTCSSKDACLLCKRTTSSKY